MTKPKSTGPRPPCPVCGGEVIPGPRAHNKKCCSEACSAEWHRRKCQELNERRRQQKYGNLTVKYHPGEYGGMLGILTAQFGRREAEKKYREWTTKGY